MAGRLCPHCPYMMAEDAEVCTKCGGLSKPDHLTTAENVALAEYCGHDHKMLSGILCVDDPLDIETHEPCPGIPWVEWNPAEYANQRDELVEAFLGHGCKVEMLSAEGDHCATIWWEADGRFRLVETSATATTPGLAVCRAALQVMQAQGETK